MSAEAKKLAISLADIRSAMTRVREHVHYTPVLQCSYMDALSGYKLYFKCENLQRTGSFKVRGATNMIQKLVSSWQGPGRPIVVTHSSGNHAQAVSLAATRCGVESHIVMPNSCPLVKVKAVEGYGGKVVLCEPTEEARKAKAQELLTSLGPSSVLVPSSNHPDIMAGQGTIALEFLEQVPDLDVVVGSVSGGGFMAGVCVGAKGMKPDVEVVLSEPKNADDCARSFEAGRLLQNASPPKTIADGLRVNVGEQTWPVLHSLAQGVVTVSEEEMVVAMKLVMERMKVVVEPSAACSIAAVLSPQFRKMMEPRPTTKVGVVLCGGNVDLDHLPWTSTPKPL